MDEMDLMVCAFPIVFMIHEFEEIIGFGSWFDRYGKQLERRYPFLGKPIRSLGRLSVQGFVMAVLEEFVIISIVTLTALVFDWYYAWIAAFTVFAFHILMHIVQWAAVRSYIPVIATSVFSLPYLLWGIHRLMHSFPLHELLLCLLIGLPFAAGNLLLAHKLAFGFDKHFSGTKRSGPIPE